MITAVVIVTLLIFSLSDWLKFRMRSNAKGFNKVEYSDKQKYLNKYEFHNSLLHIWEPFRKLIIFIAITCFAILVPGGFVSVLILWFFYWLFSTKPEVKRAKKARARELRELDEWIVVANQTILRK